MNNNQTEQKLTNKTKSKSWINRFLDVVEKVGNLLPHPATLFAGMALLVIVLSYIVSLTGVEVIPPGGEEVIRAKNLLSHEGLHIILTGLVENFTSFAPLGTVLVALLGIGVAEGSGLIGTALRLVVIKTPPRLLTFVVVFAGVVSNTASEVGYVLLVPLAAIIFLAAGRHPFAGLAAAFAGVSGGYSANILLGTIDPLLAGISQEAAHILEPGYLVNPASNYYFMFVSTFFIAIVGTAVTELIVIPKLGKYTGDMKPEEIQQISKDERRGLKWATISIVLMLAVITIGLIPDNGFLRTPLELLNPMEENTILTSTVMKGIVSIIFILAAVAGIAYGIGAKTIKNDADVMKGMSKSMETLGSYIVLVFFAAQFVAFFNETNIGLIIAVKGADFLRSISLSGIPLIVSFIIVAAAINLVMGSASAKWAILAPVFIPMFMLLGFSPEFTQLAYRIGDSCTNIISPMMSYFALIVAFMQKYDSKAGIGTIVSTMLPYSIAFLVVWILLLIVWMTLGLEIGPDAPLLYNVGSSLN